MGLRSGPEACVEVEAAGSTLIATDSRERMESSHIRAPSASLACAFAW